MRTQIAKRRVMGSKNKSFLDAHTAYFSNIRHCNGCYKFSQIARDILTHRANSAPTITQYGPEAFDHDKHPDTASAALFAEAAISLVQ